MPRTTFAIACIALCVSAGVCHGQDGTWAFRPRVDKFTDDALLDLRSMNEKQSGRTGFVHLSKDGSQFLRGDGEPIRFWAIGSDVYKTGDGAKMDEHCRFLAKLGVNMIRLHTTVANTKEGADINDVNEKTIDHIFRFIKSARDNGIYITLSPFYGSAKTPRSWKLAGYGPDRQPWGAIFIDPRMQSAYKNWTRQLYTRKNPYTGVAIKDDPTVAILQVHNEDSMFFWTMQHLPAPQLTRLREAFNQWLIKKYGSLKTARAAWDGNKQKDDDIANGVLALLDTYHMTRNWNASTDKRLADQTQFYAEHQRHFYASIGAYLRKELGCRQLLNATNWRTANDLKLKDIEKWTYAALDCDAENEYYGSDYQHMGEHTIYRVDPGHHIINESCLRKPLELTANFKRQVGHPFLVTETSWKNPNLYQTEGPFLIAAYQSLNGTDVVYWFSSQRPTWNLDPRLPWININGKHPWHKWVFNTPALLGMFPANAIIYRNHYLKRGDVIVHEVRSADSLWKREHPLIDDNEIYGVSRETEECKTMRAKDGRVSRAAFLVGRVQTVLGGDPRQTKVADFSKYLDSKKQTIRSSTGELELDYGVGLCTMNAPKAQGVAGFLKKAGGRFKLDDVTIESQNDYATVQVVSMDNRPLKSSSKILVQVGTTARLTDWQTKDADFPFGKNNPVTVHGKVIVDPGKPPWRVANTNVTIIINNPHIREAVLLNPSGYAARPLDVIQKEAGVVQVTLPADAMYVILK